SWVLIASPFVFKVKKPVDLGFLDFSTLEKRQHFCRRELELNRRLCPEVYLAVMPIYESDAGLSFDDATGEIVEYAVKMRELPHGWFLSELLAKGAVGETEINRVIARLHEFYESETPTPQIEEWGRPEKLRISTDENFEQVERFAGTTISPAAFAVIRAFTNNFYVTNDRLFQERIEQRRIRDCHGDLHLDHVHLTPQAVTIFDCIEFSDRFRFIDIANDIAFLAMDFDFERAHQLGAFFLRQAAREFDDPQILTLADFYKCYRAFVRGKVENLQASTEEYATRARRYFQLALRYAAVGSGPLLLVVMGRIATGKSTIARQLASEMDWPVLSSDRIRKTLTGVPLTTRTAPELRAKVYSDEVTDQTYARLIKEGLQASAVDSGAVVDATFSSRSKRDLLRAECRRAGVRLQVIELEAEQAELASRLKARKNHPAEVSDARIEDLAKLGAAYESPSELVPHLITISTRASVSETVKSILLELSRKKPTVA
ncbi:MAG: AAA family ATPase, partial [Candidatus Acidiferrum sp.]